MLKQLNVTKSEFTFSCYVYDKDHMSELRINNRSERDLRSCEVTGFRFKLNSHLTYFWRGIVPVAQSVEHHTSIAKVMGSNPVEASEFFLGFICNCLSYFATAKISFTSILLLAAVLSVALDTSLPKS